MMHLSDKALLVHLGVSQWIGKKLDKKASQEVAAMNGATGNVGNFNKTLLPTCDLLGRVKALTSDIRKDFYLNVLPWGIEGTFILPSANYLSFMTEYRGKKGAWEAIVVKFIDAYPQAKQDAIRLLGSMYKASDYPTIDEMKTKFSMDITVLPVPNTGDFRVDMIDGEMDTMRSELEAKLAESSQTAVKEVWQRLYDKVSWLNSRLADPKNTYHDETYNDTCDLVKMLARLNFMNDPNLEELRKDAETKLFSHHPQVLSHDPVLRSDTADEARAIMDKMSVFMGGL
tara:strand:- start:658 stop:1515 length:858 start_codon:yes stop_codon:yes gene_type:complete